MPLADFHRIIISTGLAAAAAAGHRDVALGGGNALIVRAGSPRTTQDVDLFCRNAAALPEIADVIVKAIEAAGYRAEQRDEMPGGWWDDDGDADPEMVELVVSDPATGAQTELQLAYFYYASDEDVPGLGPVLSLDDLAGWKTTTVANRMGHRDYVDYALLRTLYTRERLFELAGERDPGLTMADYADAAVYLDEMADEDLAPYLNGQAPSAVRDAFADWPRDTRRDP